MLRWATMVFGFVFFGVFGGDPGGWSYLVGAFGGVRVCSGLFRVVRGWSGVDGVGDRGAHDRWDAASGRRRCSVFRLVFFWMFGGDPGGVPIWSGRSAVFGFVRICSGLFRFVRDVAEGLTAGVDGMAGVVAIALCFAGVWGWGGG